MDVAADYLVALPAAAAPSFSEGGGDERFTTWATNTAECGSLATPAVQPGQMSVAVKSCGKADFQVLHGALEVECSGVTWALLGETNKWVPVSPQRFEGVTCGASFAATVIGSPGEQLAVSFAKNSDGGAGADDTQVITVQCTIGATGKAVAQPDTNTCS